MRQDLSCPPGCDIHHSSGDRRTSDVMLAISVCIDALRYRRAEEINVISLLHELFLSLILNSNFTANRRFELCLVITIRTSIYTALILWFDVKDL